MPRARHQVSTRGSRLRGLSRAARSTTISGSADASPLGGTLLGAGGLVRAYGDAVRAGLEVTGALRRTLVREHLLDLDHADAGRIESELRSRGIAILDSRTARRSRCGSASPPTRRHGWRRSWPS
jgi:hypothetical protein